jgi:hypothetical protein
MQIAAGHGRTNFLSVIDPTGVHWRTAPNDEIVIAKTKADEAPGFRFGCDLERILWRGFSQRFESEYPSFPILNWYSGWGGLYEMTPDQNGIIDGLTGQRVHRGRIQRPWPDDVGGNRKVDVRAYPYRII